MIIDSPIISGSYSASGSYNQFGNVVVSGSLTVTGSIIGTASYAETASNALTASYLSGYVSPFPFTGSAIISGSLAVTGSILQSGSFTSTGTLTAQTLIVQTITSSVVYSSGSNIFGNDLANTQVLTGSVSITGSLAVNGSNAVLSNQTSSMSASYALNATSASYAANATTASYANNSTSASYSNNSTSASYALTASFSLNVPVTSSYANNANSASYADTASFVTTAQTASFVTTAQTASFVTTAQTASFVTTAQTASFVLNAVSSSFATSASQALTASYLSGYVSPFPFTGSAIISGSLTVTGSVAVSNLQGTGVRYLIADDSGSVTAQSASAALKSTQAFTSTAGQTTFAVTNGYSTGYVDVFINGSKLATAEFTDTSGTNIVLATGSFINDTVEVVKYTPALGVTNNVLRQLTTLTASAAQTVFSASYTPGLLDIFYNGARLTPADFTANNGTYFTLATASAANDILDVLVYSYQVGAFSGIGGVGTATQVAYFDTTNSITGSPNFTISGSTMLITGSLTISGSSTFTNIGPAVFSGSLTSTAGFTGSFSGTATSASFASTASFVANAQSASNAVAAQTASYVLNAVSSSFASTASSADDLLVRGTLTAQTLVVQTITSSVDFVTGSTRFGSISENTHQFTGSVSVSGSLTGASASFSSALAANNLTGEGQAGAGGVLNLRQDAIYLPKGNGYSSIASSFSVFEFYGYTGASTYKNFTFRFDGLTDNTRRDYTLPDNSGTLALLSGSQTFNGATTFASPLTGSSAVFSGSVGIGTTSPTARLHVSGSTSDVFVAQGSGSISALHISSNGDVTVGKDRYPALYLRDTGWWVGLLQGAQTSYGLDSFCFNTSATRPFVFQSGGDNRTTGSALMFISANGSVGIGTVTPDNFKLQVSGSIGPNNNGAFDLGSSSLRWGTVYTSDLDMSNGIGDYTIVEGEDDLFLYNNKKGKVYKFMIQEVDPSEATPKMKK